MTPVLWGLVQDSWGFQKFNITKYSGKNIERSQCSEKQTFKSVAFKAHYSKDEKLPSTK